MDNFNLIIFSHYCILYCSMVDVIVGFGFTSNISCLHEEIDIIHNNYYNCG